MKPDPNAARRALIDAGVRRFKAFAKSSDPGAPGIPGCSLKTYRLQVINKKIFN